jgi:hypothetical protein
MSTAARQRELLHQLTGMGFEKPHVIRAVRRIDVSSDNAAELAIEWMADHPMQGYDERNFAIARLYS